MKQKLQFRISAELKNIIGKDLINDDFIAVFELVKNAYDAHATRVDIYFENIYKEDAVSKIIIKDNGKGMNLDDLNSKWLFLAYSAKKDGTEDESYRDKIVTSRTYAGAKGIGRFSCDRLGEELYLETIKKEPTPKVETLVTKWNDFEKDSKEEFIDIDVIHETISQSNYGLNHGTVLEVTFLRDQWGREKLLKLKTSLAKLINPNTRDKSDTFDIFLHVEEEKEIDSTKTEYHEMVNGKIENLIFETLDFKTSKIISNVGDIDPKTGQPIITTSLYEGGELIYKIKERGRANNQKLTGLNTPLSKLHNINYVIYHMTNSAKNIFTRRMGVRSVDYGHIFIYKNGIRIYPYGERDQDPLKMDFRKTQGYNRFIGTREALGYIEILGENPELKETTSRGDGLEKNETYTELVAWFLECLKRLEKYNKDVTNWGIDLSQEDFFELVSEEQTEAFRKMVLNLNNSPDVIEIEYTSDLIKRLEQKQKGSAKSILKDIKARIASDNFTKEEVLKEIGKAENKIEKLKDIKAEAEEEALHKMIENESLKEQLEVQTKKNLFHQSVLADDPKHLLSLQHQIRHTASNISSILDDLMDAIYENETKAVLTKYIANISKQTLQIRSLSSFVTRANFNVTATKIKEPLPSFIKNYIDEMYMGHNPIKNISPLEIEVVYSSKCDTITKFRPLEVTILIDNFISNTYKAEAKKMSFYLSTDKKCKYLFIRIEDDGNGIKKELIEKVFELGVSTTDGSGIGLYIVKDIVENSFNGEITIDSTVEKGSAFNLKLEI